MKSKKALSFILAVTFIMLNMIFVSADQETTVTGVLNEVYIYDAGGPVQCLILTLDQEETFEVWDSYGDTSTVTTSEIQISSRDYSPEMDGTRVIVSGNDLMEGLTFYHIRPVVMFDAHIKSIPEPAESVISVTVNGEAIYFDQPPIIKNDRVFIPIRAVAENLGAKVDYYDDYYYKSVVITDEKHTARFSIGDTECRINGISNLIDAAPFIENGRTLLPIRIAAQAMGCDVLWDGDNKTVIITKTYEDEENVFSNIKVDADFPLIYNIPDSQNYGKSVPFLNINKEQAATASAKMAEAVRSANELWDTGYNASVNNSVISFMAFGTYDGGDNFFSAVNYDIENDAVLSNQELLSRIGLNEDTFKTLMYSKCEACFDERYPRSITIEDRGISEEFYYEQRSNIKSDWCVSIDYPIFIDEAGSVFAVVCMPGFYGGDFDYAIDTGIKITKEEK